MPFETAGSEVLTEEECLRLVGAASLGRIVFTDRALPAIQPVTFAMSRGDVIIRTSTGSRLAAAASDTVVAFEVDDICAATRTGWSVVLVGRARAVTGAAELAELRRLPLQADGRDDRFIRLHAEIVSGRRIARSVF